MKVQNVRGVKIVQQKALSQGFALREIMFRYIHTATDEEMGGKVMVLKEKRAEKMGRDDNYFGSM